MNGYTNWQKKNTNFMMGDCMGMGRSDGNKNEEVKNFTQMNS